MAACLPLPLNRSSSRKCFADDGSLKNKSGCNENPEIRGGDGDEAENLSVSNSSMPRKLVRSVSLKLKRFNLRFDQEEQGVDEDARIDPLLCNAVPRDRERSASGRCLGFYAKNSRCRVGDDAEIQPNGVDKVAESGCGSVVNREFEEERERNGGFTIQRGLRRCRTLERIIDVGIEVGKKRSVERRKLKDLSTKSCDASVGTSGVEIEKKSRMELLLQSTTEKLWRRGNRRGGGKTVRTLKTKEEERRTTLPDEILEMCLARASFVTLLSAKLVCRKWRWLISSSHFMGLRADCASQRPWLFLFGLSRDGVCVGQIQALETGRNKWHKIDAEILRGRCMFSVASVSGAIYVVGGCSTLNHNGRIDKSSYRRHKTVLVYNPLSGSWKNVAPLSTARVMPILSVLDEAHGWGRTLFAGHLKNIHSCGDEEEYSKQSMKGNNKDSWRPTEPRTGRCFKEHGSHQNASANRQLWEMLKGSGSSDFSSLNLDLRESCQGERVSEKLRESRNYGLVVAGGHGKWDEPLDSVEIYDPVSDRWREITKVPAGHGSICAGVICKGCFYVYSETDNLAAYDFEKGIWMKIQIANSPIRLPEYSPKMVSCRDRLFMLCVSWCERQNNSTNNNKAVRKMWELDLNSHSWTDLSRHPDAPLDRNPAFVGNADQVYVIEMFKIFGHVLDFVTVCDISDAKGQWNRISRKHVAQGVDASSCITKTVAIMQL